MGIFVAWSVGLLYRSLDQFPCTLEEQLQAFTIGMVHISSKLELWWHQWVVLRERHDGSEETTFAVDVDVVVRQRKD